MGYRHDLTLTMQCLFWVRKMGHLVPTVSYSLIFSRPTEANLYQVKQGTPTGNTDDNYQIGLV